MKTDNNMINFGKLSIMLGILLTIVGFILSVMLHNPNYSKLMICGSPLILSGLILFGFCYISFCEATENKIKYKDNSDIDKVVAVSSTLISLMLIIYIIIR